MEMHVLTVGRGTSSCLTPSFSCVAAMFGLLQHFTELTAGQQSWGEMGGGVDSGLMKGSGQFVTEHMGVSDEVLTFLNLSSKFFLHWREYHA